MPIPVPELTAILLRIGLTSTLILGVAGVLSGCAHRPKPGPLPDQAFEEPITAPAPEKVRKPALTHLESHVFTVSAADSVVGSLGKIELREGDTLSNVARHFGLGYDEITAANSSLDPWVIQDRTVAWLPAQFILPKAARRGIVINLAAMRLFHFPAADGGAKVVTYPVGIGKEGRSTPTGTMAIAQKKKDPTWRPTPNILSDHLKRGDPLPAVVPPGPDNPLGQYAMYLTTPRYLIHGTNKPYSIGLRASNGCIRLYPENVEKLFPAVAVREPVTIVNQPYLIGSKDGVLYLQAYQPHEEVNASAAKQRVRADLKTLEQEGKHLDWPKINQILAEEHGIPMPISAGTPSIEAVLSAAVELQRPSSFYGQPILPPEDPSGWHVIAAETASEMSARRMAGIMNHQGPPIPARVVEAGERYRVIAGPYPDAKSAQKAAKRIKADLELDSQVLAPDTALAGTAVPSLPAPEPAAIPIQPEPEPEPSAPYPEPAAPSTEGPAVTPEYPMPVDQNPFPETSPVAPTTYPEPEAVPTEMAPAYPTDSLPVTPEQPAESPPPLEPTPAYPSEPWPAAPPASETPNAPLDSETSSSEPSMDQPLDLSVPDQFTDPTAPRIDPSLETQPNMGSDTQPTASGPQTRRRTLP